MDGDMLLKLARTAAYVAHCPRHLIDDAVQEGVAAALESHSCSRSTMNRAIVRFLRRERRHRHHELHAC